MSESWTVLSNFSLPERNMLRRSERYVCIQPFIQPSAALRGAPGFSVICVGMATGSFLLLFVEELRFIPSPSEQLFLISSSSVLRWAPTDSWADYLLYHLGLWRKVVLHRLQFSDLSLVDAVFFYIFLFECCLLVTVVDF